MIDKTDVEILNILQENARTSNAEIARKVGKAPSAVLERVRKLERTGVIQGYEARINPEALDRTLTAFTRVDVVEAVGSTDTGEQLADIPGVLEVHYTAGEDTYLLKVRVANTASLAEMLRNIGLVPSVRDTKSTIVLRTVKETGKLPIEPYPEE